MRFLSELDGKIYREVLNEENFSGYDINVSYHDMAKAAVELLECRFRQPELPPQTSIVKGTLAKIEPGGEKLIL